jgi:hypothetical protein
MRTKQQGRNLEENEGLINTIYNNLVHLVLQIQISEAKTQGIYHLCITK